MTTSEMWLNAGDRGALAPAIRPGPHGLPRAQVSEAQRLRILSAMAHVVCEWGVESASVTRIAGRAGVSRRTFYDLFEDRLDCFMAVFNEAVALARKRMTHAYAAENKWVDRVRASLFALLELFDEEPQLAQICVVHALAAGPAMLARRRAVLDELVQALDQPPNEQPNQQPTNGSAARPGPLVAQGVIGGALSVIHARLLSADAAPLIELSKPLTSMIVLPYLGPSAARRELARLAPKRTLVVSKGPRDPLAGLDIRVTYRTLRVLAVIAAQTGSSNREVAAQAGIVDQGQISKLLARLERLGLIDNTCDPQLKGGANAWILTARGREVQAWLASDATVLAKS